MKYLKYYYLTILIVITGLRGYAQETNISGVINTYIDVTAVEVANDSTVTVSDENGFSVGDTVMLIQMKGADVEWYSQGQMKEPYSSGKYEFLIINAINGGANQITFTADIMNTYSTADFVQLIRVPGYRNANVTSNLTCEPWDSVAGTGGILTFMVHDTLKLNNSVDVTGKGFLGAPPKSSSAALCSFVPATYFATGEYLHEDADSAGIKGESVAMGDINRANGYGRWINGGGGGKGRFAGGGGGSNVKTAGVGGWESNDACNDSLATQDGLKGRGGGSLELYDGDSTIYLGGGGGSGISYGVDNGSTGGDGGGVIVILANVIIGNNQNIISDGESVLTAVTGSGAGGGGAGTILLEINSYAGSLSIDATGGDGGNTNHSTYFRGPGGGGSGGRIRLSSGSLPLGVITDMSGGTGGISENVEGEANWQATDGSDGEIAYNLRVPLNGFVFNTILDDETICENTTASTLIGSSPRGAKDSTYFWQQSNNLSSWSSASGINNEQNYSPGVLTDTTYYRRIIEYTNFKLLRYQDTSNVVKITVQPEISSNTIQDVDTICYNSTPTGLTGLLPGGGDGISYAYNWESSINQSTWSTTGESSQNYSPAVLIDTTYYHRIVTSGACIDTSNVIEITVLPSITNNAISPAQKICEHGSFALLNGSLPQNGDGSYTYKWEASVDNSDWRDTIISNTVQNYFPHAEALFYPGSVYYRRIVYSGFNDCCEDTSSSILLEVVPEIKNNLIEEAQTVCYGTSPAELTTSTLPLSDGETPYSFVWENSLDDAIWTEISGETNESYQSGNLTQNTYFRRIVNAGVCSDTSSSVFVDLRPLPIANILPLRDSTCSGSSINLTFSITGINPPWDLTYTNGAENILISGISSSPHSIAVNPITSSQEEEFLYSIVSVVDSESCAATDLTGKDTIIVYGIPDANAGVKDSVCSKIYVLNPVPSVGDGVWTTMTSASISNPIQSNSNVTVEDYGIYIFTWTETNWKCPESSDEVEIEFFEEPMDPNAGLDTTIFFNDSITLRASAPSAGIGIWNLIDGEATINGINDSITKITELVQGENIFRWTVSNGNCPEHYDEIVVSVEDITIPKGFHPDGDNFIVHGLQNNPKVKLCKFIVFNRWGKKVYETTDINFEWKGTYNNEELPDGTYYYIIEINETNSYKGFFIIKKQ